MSKLVPAVTALIGFLVLLSSTIAQTSVEDRHKALRKAYVETSNEHLQSEGLDSHMSEDNGKLTVTDDSLKSESIRAEWMRKLFPPSVRRDLCKIGFKSVSFKDGYIIYSETVYSMGCPETKEETAARVKLDTKGMADYAASLQADFKNEPSTRTAHVTVSGTTLVITGAGNSNLGKMMASDPGVKRQLCGLGFRGTRSGGVYASLGCR